jgi:hypothetical protein
MWRWCTLVGCRVVGVKARAWRDLREACDASSACCALLSTLLSRSREADDGGRVSAISARTGASMNVLPERSANASHTSREKHRVSQVHTYRRLHAGRLFGAGERVKRTEQGLSSRDPPPTEPVLPPQERALFIYETCANTQTLLSATHVTAVAGICHPYRAHLLLLRRLVCGDARAAAITSLLQSARRDGGVGDTPAARFSRPAGLTVQTVTPVVPLRRTPPTLAADSRWQR